MNNERCQVQIDFVGQACHGYPLINIDINGTTLFHNEIVDSMSVKLDCVLQDNNRVTISLLNKQNGPDVYDTVIDEQGNILQDKNCKIVDIYLNKAKVSFLLHNLVYNYADGQREFIYGYMSQNGSYTIDFPKNVFDWIIESRKRLIPERTTQSSLSYDSLAYMENDQQKTAQLIADCKKILEQF